MLRSFGQGFRGYRFTKFEVSRTSIMMQRTANENAACIRRICKRPDKPKIERIINNDARLILRRKLNGATT